MATRRTIYKLKNNQTDGGALPSSGVQLGEPLVNLYNGILFFSGASGGDFVQSDNNSSYFEVGSNLYNLELRNQITTYSGITGAGLVDKFLRGTTTGFVLDDISNIAGIDSYVTGGTWSPNTLTLSLNEGKPNITVNIDSFNNVNLYGTTNVNGDITVTGTTNLNGTSYYNNTATESNELVNYGLLTAYTQTNEVYVTGGTNNGATDNTNSASIDLEYNQIIPNGTYSLTYTDSYTTGATLNGSIVNFTRNDGVIYSVNLSSLAPTGFTDTYVTGFTKSGNILTISRNQGEPDLTVDISTLNSITVNGDITVTGTTQTQDLNVTGFVTSNLIPNTGCTYDLGSTTNRWNDIWVKRVRIGSCTTDLEDDNTQFIVTVGGTSSGATFNLNGGDMNVGGDLLPIGDLTYNIGEPSNRWNTVYAGDIVATGVTISSLSPNRVVYTNGSGNLATETGFEYDESTDRMTVGALTVNNTLGTISYIGQGGLTIGSGGSTVTPGIGDLTVHGNLIVFGTGTTIATSELYVEDPQITLNYNPTGNTSITSIASGIRIQDGDGISGDTYFTVAQMNTFTGGDVTEYTGPTGYTNRAFLTQLNDIVIRNTNLNNGAPDGVRVLAEHDILDGGTY